MFQGLRTVICHAADLSAAKEWYTKALGMQPYFDQPFYVGFNIAGYEFGLDPDPSSATGTGTSAIAYWGVADVEASRHVRRRDHHHEARRARLTGRLEAAFPLPDGVPALLERRGVEVLGKPPRGAVGVRGSWVFRHKTPSALPISQKILERFPLFRGPERGILDGSPPI